MLKYILGAVCVLGLCSTVSYAADKDKDDEPRKAIECFPAKDIVKFFNKIDELKPERRDTIDAFMTAEFKVDDGGPLPDRIFIRDDRADTPFTIMPDGKVPDFARVSKASKESELCAEDQARAGILKSEDGIEFSIDMDVRFKNQSGRHDIAELEDGVGDGKSFYKKMVPGPLSIMIPKMTHVSVTYEDETTPAQITAYKNNTPLEGLILEPFSGSHIIEFKHLEALGADELRIAGGSYILEPTPSIEKLKTFGNDDDEDKGE